MVTMRKYFVEGIDADGVCRAAGEVLAAEVGEAVWNAQIAMMQVPGICSYAVYRPTRLRRRRSLVTVARGTADGWGRDDPGADGGLAGVREPRRPKPGPGHLIVALDPPA